MQNLWLTVNYGRSRERAWPQGEDVHTIVACKRRAQMSETSEYARSQENEPASAQNPGASDLPEPVSIAAPLPHISLDEGTDTFRESHHRSIEGGFVTSAGRRPPSVDVSGLVSGSRAKIAAAAAVAFVVGSHSRSTAALVILSSYLAWKETFTVKGMWW